MTFKEELKEILRGYSEGANDNTDSTIDEVCNFFIRNLEDLSDIDEFTQIKNKILSDMSKQLVKEVAIDLITKNNQTTNKEIKEELWNVYNIPKSECYQELISNYMKEILEESDMFEFVFNGTYRVYKFKQTQNTNNSVLLYEVEWICSERNNEMNSVIVKAISRGKARVKGSKLLNIHYNDTHASEV